jgi:hypothetical protein
MTHGRLWYVRRGTTVRGPFQAALIKRYMFLGRVKQTDELSLDQKSWLPVTAYPGFAEDEGTAGGMAAVAASVKAAEDERRSGAGNQGYDGPERRAVEPAETVERRQRRERVLASLRRPRGGERVPVLIAVLVTVVVVVAGFLFAPDRSQSVPQCDARPAAKVNWSNCRKEGADLQGATLANGVLTNARLTGARLTRANLSGANLAYADFVGADLSYAQLKKARMTGTNLRNADLGYANLDGADLSYADLTGAVLGEAILMGAVLDRAIWPDGTVCGEGSVGICRP